MKTLLFCTTYATTKEQWDGRYKSWYDYYTSSKVHYDKLLMFDDGSPLRPDFCNSNNLYTFSEHLGKRSIINYDGWYRSFSTAIKYAKEAGFDKIVHCEADAYLLSDRIINLVNSASFGWHTFWCPKHNMQESAIQIICADQIESCIKFTSEPYDKYRNQAIDCLFPYTDVHQELIGDRYGEYGTDSIPDKADYSCQTSPNMLNNYKK